MGPPFLGVISVMPGSPPTPHVPGFAKKVLHKDFALESEREVLWFKIKGEK